ncbi:MAG: TIGR03545 family protein [Elusimicrobiota bacterium]|jgi:uncharacterized protein (TIGR03545 family)
MIRRSYVLSRASILALVWVFFAFAFDPLAQRAVEASASRALGAKVDLSLRTRFFPPSAHVRNFSAADPSDPWKDLVRFQKARFLLEGRPLLERKVVIRAAEIEGLSWGAPRKRSGALRKAPASASSQALSKWAGQAKDLGLDAASEAKNDLAKEYVVRPEDLSSLKLAKELEERWPARLDEWKRKTEAFDAEGRIREISRLAEEAGKSGDILRRLRTVKELQGKAQELRKGIEELRKGASADLAKAKTDLAGIESAKAADLAEIQKRLHLPSLDARRLSSYLLGQQGASHAATALRLIEAARKRMPSKGETARKEARRGQTVEFPRERSWPAFWLKHAKLTGTAQLGGPVQLGGEASDFSSNPSLVAQPSRLKIGGSGGGSEVLLSAEFDHRTEEPRDSVDFRAQGIPVKGFSTGEGSSLALIAGPGTASSSGRLEFQGDALKGRIEFREKDAPLTLKASGLDPSLARALESSLQDIRVLELRVDLSGTLQSPQMSITSNIGTALAQGVQKALGREIAARTQALKAQVDGLVGEKTRSLSKNLDGQAQSVLSSLGMQDTRIKELQERLARQAVGGLPDLKRLFK